MSEELVERQDGVERKLGTIIKIGYIVLTMGVAMGGWLAKTEFTITENMKDIATNGESISELEQAIRSDHEALVRIEEKLDALNRRLDRDGLN